LKHQSGSRHAGFQVLHPLAQSDIVALKFLDPPVELCVGEVDGSPGFSESCLHLFSRRSSRCSTPSRRWSTLATPSATWRTSPYTASTRTPMCRRASACCAPQFFFGRRLIESAVHLLELPAQEGDQVLIFAVGHFGVLQMLRPGSLRLSRSQDRPGQRASALEGRRGPL